MSRWTGNEKVIDDDIGMIGLLLQAQGTTVEAPCLLDHPCRLLLEDDLHQLTKVVVDPHLPLLHPRILSSSSSKRSTENNDPCLSRKSRQG
jgi:hypothetical protein